MEEILSVWLNASSDRHFSLVIADRISGVHDGKGKHSPIAYQVAGSTLIIEFEGSERLTVSNAMGISTGPNGELVVRDASEASFTWYSHNDPSVAPRRCEEVFRKTGRFVEFSRAGDPFVTSVGLVYKGDQFVLLRLA
ncbi:MAG TPA: hypothetical protein VK249_30285 [Anaerolineales bacterium]|nr:hypothetical protein [Anaerolineales bacterium]